jgi:hypothetical protein
VRGLRLAGLLAVVAVVLVLAGSLLLGRFGDAPPPEEPHAAGARAPDGTRVTVEVLNAAGLPGLARGATRQLREAGFDVVYFGNAHEFGQDSTLVLDRSGKPEAARRVAENLGVERVIDRPDSTLLLDVTVVIGRDWSGAREAAAADSAGG